MGDIHRGSFQDIRDEVLRRIYDRVWAPGALLPSETELAEEFGCARATVNRAMRELAEQGIVDRKRKSGTRVSRAPVRQATFEIPVVRHTIEAQNARYRYTLLSRSLIKAPSWLRSRLGLSADTEVLHLRCIHLANGRPYQFEERWINTEAVPDVLEADFTEIGPNEWLVSEIPFSNAEIAFAAVSADADLADFLDVSAGTSLLQMERMTWFKEDTITFVRMTHHPGYQIRTRY